MADVLKKRTGGVFAIQQNIVKDFATSFRMHAKEYYFIFLSPFFFKVLCASLLRCGTYTSTRIMKKGRDRSNLVFKTIKKKEKKKKGLHACFSHHTFLYASAQYMFLHTYIHNYTYIYIYLYIQTYM